MASFAQFVDTTTFAESARPPLKVDCSLLDGIFSEVPVSASPGAGPAHARARYLLCTQQDAQNRYGEWFRRFRHSHAGVDETSFLDFMAKLTNLPPHDLMGLFDMFGTRHHIPHHTAPTTPA